VDFTAIDFETANGKRTSACSLGIAVIKNSMVVETRTWIIKPQPFEVNYFNSLINGFTEDSLIDKPSFRDCWDEIEPYIKNCLIVAHNAAFDISVLTSTLNYYDIECPSFNFLCTYQASKKIFNGLLNYRLDTIATSLGMHFNHHDAEEDAIAAANILIHMVNVKKCDCVEDFSKSINLRIGRTYPSYFTSCI
jgi:DNA polymerase-3 subunit epsilon